MSACRSTARGSMESASRAESLRHAVRVASSGYALPLPGRHLLRSRLIGDRQILARPSHVEFEHAVLPSLNIVLRNGPRDLISIAQPGAFRVGTGDESANDARRLRQHLR